MSIKNLLRRWLLSEPATAPRISFDKAVTLAQDPSDLHFTNGSRNQITIVTVQNGYLVSFGIYNPNPHGPDWQYVARVVPEGEDVMEAVKHLWITRKL